MLSDRVLFGESQVVPQEGTCLNQVFQELADWEHQLKALEEDIPKELGGDFEEPSP